MTNIFYLVKTVLRDQLTSREGKKHDLREKIGAFQTIEQGRMCRSADVAR